MKLKFLLLIMFTCSLISCGKKTQVKGTVYSKNNVPVPNAPISYEEHIDGSPLNTYEDVLRTDRNGAYLLDLKTNKNYVYYIRCHCDSGYRKVAFEKGKANNLNLELE